MALGIGMFLFAHDFNSVEYYSDDKNYDSFECKVRSFKVYDDLICIDFEHSQENYYNNFKINGKNLDLAIENGLQDILRENVVFTVTSADAYLGDGWKYPIVALTYDGNEIIPFAEGKQNNIEFQQQAENFAIKYFAITGGIFVFLFITDSCLLIGYYKKRNKCNSQNNSVV